MDINSLTFNQLSRWVFTSISEGNLSSDDIGTIVSELGVVVATFTGKDYNKLVNKPSIPNVPNPPNRDGSEDKNYSLLVPKNGGNSLWKEHTPVSLSEIEKLNGFENSAQANVIFDWGQNSQSSDSYIKNKFVGEIPKPVQADWNISDPNDLAFIKNRNIDFGRIAFNNFPVGNPPDGNPPGEGLTESEKDKIRAAFSLTAEDIGAIAFKNTPPTFTSNLKKLVLSNLKLRLNPIITPLPNEFLSLLNTIPIGGYDFDFYVLNNYIIFFLPSLRRFITVNLLNSFNVSNLKTVNVNGLQLNSTYPQKYFLSFNSIYSLYPYRNSHPTPLRRQSVAFSNNTYTFSSSSTIYDIPSAAGKIIDFLLVDNNLHLLTYETATSVRILVVPLSQHNLTNRNTHKRVVINDTRLGGTNSQVLGFEYLDEEHYVILTTKSLTVWNISGYIVRALTYFKNTGEIYYGGIHRHQDRLYVVYSNRGIRNTLGCQVYYYGNLIQK